MKTARKNESPKADQKRGRSMRKGSSLRSTFQDQAYWLVVSLLLLSSLVVFPLHLPSVAAAPYGGNEPTPTNLTVFLHNTVIGHLIEPGLNSSNVSTTGSDTATPWAGTGGRNVGLHFLDMSFYLYPHLAGPLVLNGTPVANIYVNQTGSVSSVTWTFTLYAIDTSGVSHVLGTAGAASTNLDDGSIGKFLRIPYGSALNTTLPAGWTLEADFNQYNSGATADHYGFWWGDVGGAYYVSNINLPASTYLAINPAYITMGGKVTGALNTTAPHPVVNLTANVTDPLGNYDYLNYTVNWNVTNVSGAVMAQGTMAAAGPALPPSPTAYNETYIAAFNYSGLSPGAYKFCANATDNTYHNDLSLTGNYFGRNAQGCASFFIGSAPNLLTLRVVDSKGLPLHGAKVVVSGLQNLTNATGLTHFLLANGSYTSSVSWEGIVVARPTLNVSGPTVLTVSTQVYYPVFSIEDQSNVALSNALVYVVHPNGTQYPLMITNNSGNLSFPQVPVGIYGITVIWHDSVVYSQPAQPALSVSSNAAIPVVTQVFYQEFQIVEPSGTPIALASVVVQNSTTGILVSFGITNSTGMTTSRIPAGSFTVLVYWQTSLIATVPGLALPANNPYVITASLFSVTFEARDSQGLPVGNAVIGVAGAAGTITNLVTNSSGGAQVVLPGGTYTFTTSWEGVVVNTTTLKIASSQTVNLSLSIYYLTFDTVDSAGIAVSDASVQWGTAQGQANGSVTTNASGEAIVRLPGTAYQISVSWEGVPVDSVAYTLSASGTLPLKLSIYYLTVQTLDANGLPVAGAAVSWVSTVGAASGTVSTNSSGLGVARLPGATFDLTTVWEGVTVNQTSNTLTATTTWVLHLAVYYLTFVAKDANSVPVGDASISVSLVNGGVSVLLLTATNGSAVARVPVGNYTVSVSWEAVTVYQGNTTANGDKTVPLSLEIYYLTVQTVDKNGNALPGVFLQVRSATTGAAVDSAISTSQPTIFRLPVGSYAVVGTYSSTYDLTPVQQTLNQSVTVSSSGSVTLKFTDVNPAFTSTNEFYAILGVVLLALIILLLIYMLARRKTEKKETPAPTAVSSSTKEETSPPEGSDKPAEESRSPPPSEEKPSAEEKSNAD